jgi:hypothetical protein
MTGLNYFNYFTEIEGTLAEALAPLAPDWATETWQKAASRFGVEGDRLRV